MAKSVTAFRPLIEGSDWPSYVFAVPLYQIFLPLHDNRHKNSSSLNDFSSFRISYGFSYSWIDNLNSVLASRAYLHLVGLFDHCHCNTRKADAPLIFDSDITVAPSLGSSLVVAP